MHHTHVRTRPLLAGGISRTHALLLVYSSISVSLLLSIFMFFSVLSIVVLITVFCFMTLYNKYSKRHAGMEYALGLGVFTLGIFGALTAAAHVSLFAVIISGACSLQWLFSVGVSANLKDVNSV